MWGYEAIVREEINQARLAARRGVLVPCDTGNRADNTKKFPTAFHCHVRRIQNVILLSHCMLVETFCNLLGPDIKLSPPSRYISRATHTADGRHLR
jgi:hypothetical protein